MNRGEEKVRVHMNVVPRSAMNTNGGTLIYTSDLILCSTICVHSATRHNIHMYLFFDKINVRRFPNPLFSNCTQEISVQREILSTNTLYLLHIYKQRTELYKQ